MKYLLVLFLCLSSYWLTRAQPLCTSPFYFGNNTCGSACWVCDLDGFSATVGMNSPGSLPPGFCGSGNTNSSWFRFRVQSASLSLLIHVTDTSFAPLQGIGIYRTTNVCNNPVLVSACESFIEPGQSAFLAANNLSPSDDYFLVAVADPSALSNFSVEVLSGNSVWPAPGTPQISAQGPFCPGGTFPFAASNVGNGTYNWTVNGQHAAVGTNVNLTMPANSNSVQVCVTVSDGCASGQAACQTYPLTPLPLINMGTITLCPGEIYNLGGIDYSLPGVYIITTNTPNGCDQPVRFRLEYNPNPQIYFFAQICEGESYQIGNSEFDETGIYTEVLTTYLGCDSTVTVNLTVLPNSNTVVTDTICPGGVYHFGGNTYTQAGQYDFQYIAANGCDSTLQLNLVVSPQLAPMVEITGNTTFCPGGAVSLDVNGTGNVLWSTGDTTTTIVITPDSDTLITVTALDNAGCAGMDSVWVVAAPPVQAPGLSCQNATLSALEVLINLPQGYVIDTVISTSPGQLNTGLFQMAGLSSGESVSLEVQALSPEGCLAVAAVSCNTLDCASATASILPIPPQCSEGNMPITLAFTASGAVNPALSWSGPGITDILTGIFDPAIAGVGNHPITLALEEAGCNFTAQTLVKVNAPASIADINTVCSGDDYFATFEVDGPDSLYLYTSMPAPGGSPLEINLQASPGCPDYQLNLIRNCNCGNTPGSFANTPPISVCGAAQITVDLPADAVPGPGEQPFFVLHDNSGNVLGNVFAVFNGPAQLEYTPNLEYGRTYYLSPVVGKLLGNGLPDTQYACANALPGRPVVFGPEPQVTLPGEWVLCPGESIQLEPQPANATNIHWSPTVGLSCADCPNPIATPAATTTYTATVTGVGACLAQATTTIFVGAFPPSILPPELSLCAAEDIDICLPAGFTYQWSGPNGFASASPCLTQLDIISAQAGDYTVVATSADGCVFTNTIALDLAPEVLVSNFPENQIVCPNQIVGFAPVVENAVYHLWYPSLGLSCPTCLNTLASVRRTTTYTLIVIDANGCAYYYPVTLTVDAGFCGGVIVSSGLSRHDSLPEQPAVLRQTNDKALPSLYPNPVKSGGIAFVYLPASDLPYAVQLRDSYDRIQNKVEISSIITGYYPVQIPENLPSGVFYLQYYNENGTEDLLPVMVVE